MRKSSLITLLLIALYAQGIAQVTIKHVRIETFQELGISKTILNTPVVEMPKFNMEVIKSSIHFLTEQNGFYCFST